MSDWRSLGWKSGRLISTLALDRQGLNANTREGYLPLETQGGTTTYVISANTTGTYTNNGLTNVEVTKIRELNNTTSYAGSTSGGVVSWAVGDREHTLIRFNDLSGIGAGTVTNAEVGFYVINTDSSSKDIEIRALTQAWDYFNTTWDEYSSGITWDTAGALGVGDRGSVLATATATGSTGYWVQFSGPAVDTWVQNCIAGTDVYETLYVGYVNDTAYSNIYEEFEYSLGTNGFRPYLSFDWAAGGAGPTIVDLTAATFSFLAQTVQNKRRVLPTNPTLGFTAQAVQNKRRVLPTSAALNLVAQSVQNRRLATLTQATLSFVAQAVQNKRRVLPTAASLSLVAQSVQNRLLAKLTSANLNFTALAVEFVLGAGITVVDLTAATFSFVAQEVRNVRRVVLTSPTLTTTAQTVQNRLRATVTAASLTLSAQAVTVRRVITTTTASLVFTAQSVQNKLTVKLTSAILNFQGMAVDMFNVVITTLVARARKSYSNYRRMLKQRRF
jgi:hypothetical protein